MSYRRFLSVFILTALFFSQTSQIFASEPHHFGGLMPEELISADELRQKQLKKENFVLFDARVKKTYDEGHIEGAILPLTKEYYFQEELFRQGMVKSVPDKDVSLAENLKQYSKDTAIIAYCNTNCQASAVLVYKIKKLGFTDVRAMEDGFQVWQKKAYPTADVPKPSLV